MNAATAREEALEALKAKLDEVRPAIEPWEYDSVRALFLALGWQSPQQAADRQRYGYVR